MSYPLLFNSLLLCLLRVASPFTYESHVTLPLQLLGVLLFFFFFLNSFTVSLVIFSLKPDCLHDIEFIKVHGKIGDIKGVLEDEKLRFRWIFTFVG